MVFVLEVWGGNECMICKRLPARSCCDPLGSSITDRLRLGTAETGQPIAAGPGDDASAALDEGHGAGTERIRDRSRAIGADRRTAGAARGVARVERAIGLDRPVAVQARDAQVRTLEQRRVGFEADRAALDRGHGDIGRIADRRDGDARPGRNDRSGLGERGGSDDDRQGNGNGLFVEELHWSSPALCQNDGLPLSSLFLEIQVSSRWNPPRQPRETRTYLEEVLYTLKQFLSRVKMFFI